MHGRAVTLTLAVCALSPSLAHADGPVSVARADSPVADPYRLPDAPRALSLPELTHPGIEWTTTTAIGALATNGYNSPAVLERIGVESALGPRRWYLGLAYEAGYGAPVGQPPGPASSVGGNFELYGRTVWATRTGLAFGGGIGFIPPTAQGSSEVATAVISLQPWDYAFFRTGVFTARPFVDMRSIFGRFVVQFRQSFDFSINVNDIVERDVASATTIYFGWLATPRVGLGLETTEYYLVDAAIADNQRAKLVFAPNVRFLLPGVEPAIGAFVGVGTPIAPAAENIWGLRFALTFVWEPHQKFFHALRMSE
jgi:hypothetical protein